MPNHGYKIQNRCFVILFFTKKALNFSLLLHFGKESWGVKSISIGKDQLVISMITNHKDDTDDILIATENGYGKRTKLNEFSLQKRSGKGNIAVKTVRILPLS